MISFSNEQCKKNCLEVCGWLGSLSIIAAYTCITLKKGNLLFIDCMNLYGSLSVGYLCYVKKAWQGMSLEVVWFGIATYSLINHIVDPSSMIH